MSLLRLVLLQALLATPRPHRRVTAAAAVFRSHTLGRGSAPPLPVGRAVQCALFGAERGSAAGRALALARASQPAPVPHASAAIRGAVRGFAVAAAQPGDAPVHTAITPHYRVDRARGMASMAASMASRSSVVRRAMPGMRKRGARAAAAAQARRPRRCFCKSSKSWLTPIRQCAAPRARGAPRRLPSRARVRGRGRAPPDARPRQPSATCDAAKLCRRGGPGGDIRRGWRARAWDYIFKFLS